MATHSSILVWRVPGTEEPGGLRCTGLQRVDTTGLNRHAHRQEIHTSALLPNAGWSRRGLCRSKVTALMTPAEI